MNFADSLLLRLATTVDRDALLDQDALQSMIAAAFDTANAAVQGPFALDVERLDLGLEIARSVVVEGSYVPSPGALPGEARLKIAGLLNGSPLRIDSLWRGQLIARSVPQDDRVTAVAGGFTLLDLDREIISALGALPSGAALEAERRKRLIARLKAGAVAPDTIDDRLLDALLAASHVADTAALLEARGTADLARLKISFSPPMPEAVPVPIRLPATIAVLIRETLDNLSGLIADSRAIAAALAADPAVQPGSAVLRRRVPVLLLWFVPAALFNNAGWPGASPAARKTAAIQLLSGQGIALATA